MNKMTRESILQMGRGAFAERADYEMRKVIDNILDPNTKATAKRKITLTLDQGVGFFEADGGIWKLEAKSNIAKYFEEHLKDLVDAGNVVVMQ